MLPARIPDTRIDAIQRRRAHAARARVAPEVAAALSALRSAGVVVEVVGSFAQGRFRPTSDVDFLVLDAGALSDWELDRMLEQHVRSARFDLIVADRLAPGTAQLMLAHARAGAA